MSNPALIKLPAETANALRQIASALNITVTALLNTVVEQNIERGLLKPQFPGASIFQRQGFWFFCLDDKNGRNMGIRMKTASAVHDLADAIGAVASEGMKGVEVAVDGLSLKIARNGRTVIFAQDDQRRVIATSAIPQLIHWLRSAADGVQPAE